MREQEMQELWIRSSIAGIPTEILPHTSILFSNFEVFS